MKIINKFFEIYKSEHLHFLSVDYTFYKKWKWVIRLAVFLNKKYVPCEIFRKQYKFNENFVVIGLKWNGKNPKRRTNGYAKQFILDGNHKCIYCECDLNNDNVTSDHIIPISNGGNNCKVNLITCCYNCNNERGCMEFTEYLRSKNVKYRDIKDIFI